MKMLNAKDGKLGGTLERYIEYFLLIVVLFTVVAQMLPEAQTAGDTLNATGAPLASFFASNGIVFLIIMVGLVMLIIKGAIKNKK